MSLFVYKVNPQHTVTLLGSFSLLRRVLNPPVMGDVTIIKGLIYLQSRPLHLLPWAVSYVT